MDLERVKILERTSEQWMKINISIIIYKRSQIRETYWEFVKLSNSPLNKTYKIVI